MYLSCYQTLNFQHSNYHPFYCTFSHFQDIAHFRSFVTRPSRKTHFFPENSTTIPENIIIPEKIRRGVLRHCRKVIFIPEKYGLVNFSTTFSEKRKTWGVCCYCFVFFVCLFVVVFLGWGGVKKIKKSPCVLAHDHQ